MLHGADSRSILTFLYKREQSCKAQLLDRCACIRAMETSSHPHRSKPEMRGTLDCHHVSPLHLPQEVRWNASIPVIGCVRCCTMARWEM
jgi:hypothetical protein